MCYYLGIDTSNYTTSVAVLDQSSGRYQNSGRLLPVSEGKLGLRQSDAVFQHLKVLPEIVEKLGNFDLKRVSGIGVSTRPRSVEGSYMPCFVVGSTMAYVLGRVLGVECHEFSHQDGHIAAVAYAAGRLDVLKKDFLAWHLSGGTTEFLHVKPNGSQGFKIECIGKTQDISAGQLIDRTGVALGLQFPAGKDLDKLASASSCSSYFPVRVCGLDFSLSGIENKVQQMLKNQVAPEDIARFVLLTIGDVVVRATKKAHKKYGKLPVLMSGGVAGNSLLRKIFGEMDVIFAPPQYSSDNALGIAVLTAMAERKGGDAL